MPGLLFGPTEFFVGNIRRPAAAFSQPSLSLFLPPNANSPNPTKPLDPQRVLAKPSQTWCYLKETEPLSSAIAQDSCESNHADLSGPMIVFSIFCESKFYDWPCRGPSRIFASTARMLLWLV